MGEGKGNRKEKRGAAKSVSARIRVLRGAGLAWLLFLAGFSAGLYVYAEQVWPYSAVKEVMAFVVGHPGKETTLSEKLENDLDIKPSRHIEKPDGMDEFIPNPDAREVKGLPLNPRRKNPRMFLSPGAPRGYRAIYGVFDFTGTRHGVILLDPDGEIANVWQVSQEGFDWKYIDDSNVYPHGFEISPDGSIVVAFDNGSSLIKYDYCGNRKWARYGGFHHSIKFDGEGALWTWGNIGNRYSNTPPLFGYDMMKIDYSTGRLLRTLPLIQVIQRNSLIDIFGILQDDNGPVSEWIGGSSEVWHANDVEPLSRRLAQYYRDFDAGDLLVSLREPDLIFVFDPDTLRVKWWRQGLTRRQHDPDWNDHGTITVFNNNMNRDYSNVLELDPETMKFRMLFDGTLHKLYTRERGTHQFLPDGGLLITSAQQGRVLEVDCYGNVVFEFLNVYGKTGRQWKVNEQIGEYLTLSEAKFLPEDFFRELPTCD